MPGFQDVTLRYWVCILAITEIFVTSFKISQKKRFLINGPYKHFHVLRRRHESHKWYQEVWIYATLALQSLDIYWLCIITWYLLTALLWSSKMMTFILYWPFNTLRPRQDGRHFPDILKCIFLNGNVWISLTISLKCVRKVRINNIPSLVQIMAWRRPSDKPLSEPIIISLLMHICVTRPQWVKSWILSKKHKSGICIFYESSKLKWH